MPRWHFSTALTAQLAITGVAILVQVSGHRLDGTLVTSLACGLLLLFGLPHGTLDLELLRDRGVDGPGLGLLLIAYGVAAATMYAVWQLAPLLALLLFLLVAVEHFAEDWLGSRFIAYGTAVALIVTPALFHRAELAAIFTVLTGTRAAAPLGDLMLLVVPVAGVIAVAGIGLLWQGGEHRRAVGLGAALVGEALLPPVIGFALFFCFVHSPYQLREGLARLQRPTRETWRQVIVPLTLAAIALSAAIGAAALDVSFDAAALRACFVTLSVLTAPHMLVPYAVRRFRARYTPRPRARGYVPSTRTHSL